MTIMDQALRQQMLADLETLADDVKDYHRMADHMIDKLNQAIRAYNLLARTMGESGAELAEVAHVEMSFP